MINKYLLIFLLAIFIFIKLRNKNLVSKKCVTRENFIADQSVFKNSVKSHQDADKIIMSLNKETSKQLLISNNIIIPWIKNMELEEAETLYNRLFEEDLGEDFTMSELLYGKKAEDGTIILDALRGVDLDISKINMLKDEKDIYEYNELAKFLEKANFEEQREWGNKFGFDYILDENSNISSILSPSLNEIRDISIRNFELDDYLVNTSVANELSVNIEYLDSELQLDLKKLFKIKYFNMKFTNTNNEISTVTLKINEVNENLIKFKILNNESVVILGNTKVNIFPVISLYLESRTGTSQVNGKTYNFLLEEVGNVSNIINPGEWLESDYKLDFPTTFPNKYKLRVRNNKSNIETALSNIINSFGIKQGLEWKKTIADKKVILDTTIGPKNIYSLTKNTLNRIVKLNVNRLDRPKKVFSKNCLNEEEIRRIYTNLLDVSNDKFDSDESYVPRKLVNYSGQVLVDDTTETGEELLYFLRVLKIDNIYKSEKSDGGFTDNFVSSGNTDILGFPWKFKDPEPFSWDSSREDEKLKEIVQLERKKVDSNGEVVKLETVDLGKSLSPGQIIYGPNETILCKVELEINQNTNTKEIIDAQLIYLDKNNNKYSLPDITLPISWKLKSLETKFNSLTEDSSENRKIKTQLALINKLIVIRANAILSKKEKVINSFKEHKMSVKNILNFTLDTDEKKKCVAEKLADLLTNYSLVITPKAPIYTVDDILSMNRKNLASILENGIQALERVLLYNECLERSYYPNGNLLYDVNNNKINFISRNDILRLQRCVFKSLNSSISIEDNLNDITYATIRLKLILKNKDLKGSFILNKVEDIFEREVIAQTIDIINKISFLDVVLDENYQENVLKITMENDLTLERLNNIYQYLSFDDYFSVSLDLINTPEYFMNIIDEINEIQEWSSEKKANAKNAINSLKSRCMSMLDEKKLLILGEIKNNILKRQDLGENNLMVKEFINKNIALDTPFYVIKKMSLENIIIDRPVAEEGFSQNFLNYNNLNLYAQF